MDWVNTPGIPAPAARDLTGCLEEKRWPMSLPPFASYATDSEAAHDDVSHVHSTNTAAAIHRPNGFRIATQPPSPIPSSPALLSQPVFLTAQKRNVQYIHVMKRRKKARLPTGNATDPGPCPSSSIPTPGGDFGDSPDTPSPPAEVLGSSRLGGFPSGRRATHGGGRMHRRAGTHRQRAGEETPDLLRIMRYANA